MATCPHCGYESEPPAEACPLCGTALGSGEARGGEPGAAEPGPDAVRDAPPWEREGSSFPVDLFRAWKRSLFSPSEFFGALHHGRGLARGLLYYLFFTVTGAFFALSWNLAGGFGARGELQRWLGMEPVQFAVLGFFVAPFAALVGLLFFTLVFHLLILVLAPRRRSLGDTARVLCYAQSGPQLFYAVPWVGSLVALVWGLVLTVVGFREVHRTTTLRAAAVVFLPLILFATAMTLFFLAVMATVVPEISGPFGFGP